MKRNTLRIIAVLMCIMMLSSVFALSTSAESYSLTIPDGKEDVLTGEFGIFYNPESGVSTGDMKLTDGIFAADVGGKVYFNKKFSGSVDKATALEEAGPDYEFKLAGGGKVSYFYYLEFEELNCDVDSFALYFNNENSYENVETGFPYYQIDSAFDILVSQDGGETYSIAWKSVDFLVADDKIVTAAGLTTDEGGNMTEEIVTDAAGNYLYTYKYVAEDFDKLYEGVTNIVYACRAPRRDKAPAVNPFYYAARITEFDVYGTKNVAEETTAEVTTAEETTAEATTAESTSAEVVNSDTKDPEVTKAPAAETTADSTSKVEDKGCGSSAAMLSVVALFSLGIAAVRRRK